MKKIFFISVVFMGCLSMVGCGHVHNWKDATCTEAKACADCGQTEGEALGHNWEEATCILPRTCTNCGEIEGQPLGHVWEKADCEKPKTCNVCGETEGQPLGHSWKDATCIEPKTCEVCGTKDGDALGHDAETTCTEGAECLRCGDFIESPGHDWKEATCTEPKECKKCGVVEGEALGHTTSNGVCERCNIEVIEPITGKGDDVITGYNPGKDTMYKAHIKNSGARNFIVKVYYSNGSSDLLVNEIGSYDATVMILGEGPYDFEIKSHGNWSIEFEKFEVTTEETFAGKGDYVTDMFTSNASAWEAYHDGQHNFVVKAYTTSGKDLLVNTIGAYDGKVRFSVPSGSNAIFEIIADGNWSISPAN